VLTAARGGRQLPRPENLNVARRTLALSLRGWQGGPRPQQYLLAYDGGAALGDRFRTRLLATWVSRSGSSYAPPTSSPPCATVISFSGRPESSPSRSFSTSSCPLVSTWHESDVLCVPTNVCSSCSDVPRRHFNSEQFTFCLNDLAATLWQGHSADGITPRREEEGSCLARSDAATTIAR
jgi:hypothetical protein